MFSLLNITKGHEEEVAVVVMSLSDLGNNKIKAKQKKLF